MDTEHDSLTPYQEDKKSRWFVFIMWVVLIGLVTVSCLQLVNDKLHNKTYVESDGTIVVIQTTGLISYYSYSWDPTPSHGYYSDTFLISDIFKDTLTTVFGSASTHYLFYAWEVVARDDQNEGLFKGVNAGIKGKRFPNEKSLKNCFKDHMHYIYEKVLELNPPETSSKTSLFLYIAQNPNYWYYLKIHILCLSFNT